MARLKKSTSKIYDKAVTRLAALKSIDTKMDLGNGVSLEKYESVIGDLRKRMELYNTVLSNADELQNQIQASERVLNDLSERLLTGVATKFGKDSDEYEKAGGVKKSERKRRTLKPKAA